MAQHPVTPPSPAAQPLSLSDYAALHSIDLLARFARSVENFDARALKLTDAQLDTAFRPEALVGRWPVRILLGHLADAEVAVTHRIRRALAEHNPVLSLWDENAFIDSGLYGTPQTGPRFPPGAFIATIYTLRKWMAEFLATLDDDAWSRQALHPERGPISVRDMVVHDTWHLEHHARLLNLKVERFLGPPAPAQAHAPPLPR